MRCFYTSHLFQNKGRERFLIGRERERERERESFVFK
jgi:hypothetical protein